MGPNGGSVASAFAEYGPQHNLTPPPPPTPSQPGTVFGLWHREVGEGGGELERRLEGHQLFTKLGWKDQHYSLYLQSINSNKHLPQSPFTGKFF